MRRNEEVSIAELRGKLKGAKTEEGEAHWVACLIFERDAAIKMLFDWLSREEGNEPSSETVELLKRLGCTFDGTWKLPT